MRLKFIQRLFISILCLGLSFTSTFQTVVFAASLTGTQAVLSNEISEQTSVSYTISFTTATTSDTKQVNLQFATTSGGSTKPANMNLSSATLASTSGIGSGWSLNTGSAGSGLLKLTRDNAVSINAETNASISIDGITNPKIYDCTASTGLFDTCYVGIKTFSDDGSTEIDSGNTSFTIHEEPYLTFEVGGIEASITHNGITTSVASTSTSLNFGHLAHGTTKYIAHSLYIKTNAPGGYAVKAVLSEPITGENEDNSIDPFAAPDATWTTPKAWQTPDGTTANDNTGWFGANTTDTNVTGWSGDTSGKFGPLGTIARMVSTSSGPERSGKTIYVSYALGINDIQTTDSYSAKVIYNVQTTY